MWLTLGFVPLLLSGCGRTSPDANTREEGDAATGVSGQAEGGQAGLENGLDYEIAEWFQFKRSATVLTFDDLSPGQAELAIPMLVGHGIEATIFVTTANAEFQDYLNLDIAARNGIEIANHTQSHVRLVAPTGGGGGGPAPTMLERLDHEIAGANELIRARIGVVPTTFAYPFGYDGSETIDYLISSDFVGARKYDPVIAVMPYDFAADEREYYRISATDAYVIRDRADFTQTLDFAIETGGLYILVYHSIHSDTVEDAWWEPISEDLLNEHLNIVQDRQSLTWVTTFGKALRYHRERRSARLTLNSETDVGMTLTLSDELADDALYNQPLTIALTVPSGRGQMALSQAENVLRHERRDNRIVFEAVPDGGEIVVRYR